MIPTALGLLMNCVQSLEVFLLGIIPVLALPAPSEATLGALRTGGTPAAKYWEEHAFIKKVVCRRVTFGVARQLENYAAALRKVGKMAEAARITKHAKTLRTPSTRSSRYLGFSPADELQAYAKFLLARGEHSGAKKMNALADKWTYSNLTGAC
jgi:hypothetical protein